MPAKRFTKEQEYEILKEYLTQNQDGTWTGMNILGKKFGVVPETIRNILIKHGVQLRSPKEAHSNGKACKPVTRKPPVGELPPLCRCGCNQSVEWNQAKNCWRVFIIGHQEQGLYRNHEWLYYQYITLNKTTAEIAKECGTSKVPILCWLQRHGIPIRNTSTSRIGRKVGPKNPSWKGGVTPERQRLYSAQKGFEFLKAIYARDNYTCQRCGSPKKNDKGLHAHHIKPWANNPDLRFDFNNVVTLCDKCHSWVHSRKNTFKEYLG